MLDLITDPHAWFALITLSALEIVLGIDNVVFISVLVSRLPERQAKRAGQLRLSRALVSPVAFLFFLSWPRALREPIAIVLGQAISWHGIILVGGGLFLIAKATHEIHAEVESGGGEGGGGSPAAGTLGGGIPHIVGVDP